MQARTDNPNEVGMHVFERAGLGKAPFRFVGYSERKYQACPDAPVQPGASCDYCGTGIMGCYEVRSADGKRFVVGCDCIEKTGDAGLIRAYKRSPEYRAKQADARKRADERVKAGWAAIMVDESAKAKLSTFFVDGWRGREDWLGHAIRAWDYCGVSGRARYFRQAKKLLDQ